MTSSTEHSVNEIIQHLAALKSELKKVIVGQDETIDQLLITFLAGGHALTLPTPARPGAGLFPPRDGPWVPPRGT